MCNQTSWPRGVGSSRTSPAPPPRAPRRSAPPIGRFERRPCFALATLAARQNDVSILFPRLRYSRLGWCLTVKKTKRGPPVGCKHLFLWLPKDHKATLINYSFVHSHPMYEIIINVSVIRLTVVLLLLRLTLICPPGSTLQHEMQVEYRCIAIQAVKSTNDIPHIADKSSCNQVGFTNSSCVQCC